MPKPTARGLFWGKLSIVEVGPMQPYTDLMIKSYNFLWMTESPKIYHTPPHPSPLLLQLHDHSGQGQATLPSFPGGKV